MTSKMGSVLVGVIGDINSYWNLCHHFSKHPAIGKSMFEQQCVQDPGFTQDWGLNWI